MSLMSLQEPDADEAMTVSLKTDILGLNQQPPND